LKWKQGKDLTKTAPGAPPSFFTWFAFESPDAGTGDMDGPEGGDLAVQFADEIYPHAHRIFQEALEEDSDDENEEEELDESGTSL
jgi:template-activating factor I